MKQGSFLIRVHLRAPVANVLFLGHDRQRVVLHWGPHRRHRLRFRPGTSFALLRVSKQAFSKLGIEGEHRVPRKERKALEEGKDFIGDWQRQDESLAELCRRYEISRPTGYKLIERYGAEGEAGIAGRSRAPHHRRRRQGEARPKVA